MLATIRLIFLQAKYPHYTLQGKDSFAIAVSLENLSSIKTSRFSF